MLVPRVVVLAWLALTVLAAPAGAVSPVAKTFNQLVAEAELIVVGTITRVEGVRLASGPIVSDVTLSVLRVAKAVRPTPSSIVLRVLGGRVGDTALVVPGAPEFQAGQTVLLFVRGNLTEMFPFVGVQQGVFSVRRDGALGIDRVFDWRGRPVLGIRDGAVTVDPAAAATDAVPLDDFLQAATRANRG